MFAPSDPDAEFWQLMWHVIPVALGLFGIAAMVLGFLIRGFAKEDRKEDATPVAARVLILCGTLLVIALIFTILSYKA
jgi:hypothetical protein